MTTKVLAKLTTRDGFIKYMELDHLMPDVHMVLAPDSGKVTFGLSAPEYPPIEARRYRIRDCRTIELFEFEEE